MSFRSMPSNNLVSEASELLTRLNTRLADCYAEHPHLGDVPKPDAPRQIRRLKRIIWKAQRRSNRRKHAAGIPITIGGAMWMINQADSGYF